MDEPTHIPVLVNEVLAYLAYRPEPQDAASRGAGSARPRTRLIIDGTVGQGGHAERLLDALPGCRILGFDRDPVNLSIAQRRLERFSDRAVLVRDSYANVLAHASAHGFERVDGVLLDLGFSSAHVDDPERGFSFMQNGPLDMRYDRAGELTAETIVNGWTAEDLAWLFRTYGEEPAARIMARAIVEARRDRRIRSTLELADVISAAVRRRGKIHPATRAFQALRIAVNDELGELERALPVFVEMLAPGGRIAVISFHSLEDRLVKRYFKSREGEILRVLTKHIVAPSEEETRANPRARSAKLRVAERI